MSDRADGVGWMSQSEYVARFGSPPGPEERSGPLAGGAELWSLLDDMQAARTGGVPQSVVNDWTRRLEVAMTLRGRAVEDYVKRQEGSGR